MNALPIETPSKDKVVIVGQKEIEKKKLKGSIRPQKGHTLFEINLKEHSIEIAKFESKDVAYSSLVDKRGRPISKPKSNGLGVRTYQDGKKNLVLDALPNQSKTVIMKPDCVYISALNEKNALRKFFKSINK